ncbi:2-ketogluconate reductase [Halomonadaceae bacterium LMG 33818]|uniref:NAD(P)-dependent oxidoreductase n=1 Tax=Cernens ardua TaxID=3402176 RepID=UPI003EDBDD3D
MSTPILMTYALPDSLKKGLGDDYHFIGPMAEMAPQALPPEARNARVMMTKGGLPIGDELLAALPALELIHCYGTGYDRIDLDAVRRHGITLTNAGAANASAVAEYAMAMLMTGSRHVRENDTFVRDGLWTGSIHNIIPLSPGLVGRKLGIYGLGEIGKRIATRAAAMEMSVAYHGRTQHEGSPYPYFSTLSALAEWADVLVVAVRAGDNNRHAVNADILARLGTQGYVVNISRGYVIDEKALIAALKAGELQGAALDVFEHEPHVPKALLNDERVILSPHLAPHTQQAQTAMQQAAIANVRAFYRGEPLRHVIISR